MYKIPANTLFLGKQVVFMPQCQSTNSEAIKLFSEKALSDGAIVITDHQESGRGQRGNFWEAQPGMNLTFSVALQPAFLRLPDQFLLNIVTSLAISDFLKHIGIDSQIKWPNDIMIGEKKVCGILIENQLNGNKLANSVVGIGLNINQEHFSFPTATSLKQITGRAYDLSILLTALLEKLEARYLMLRSGNFQKLTSLYESMMYWKEEQHTFEANGIQFTGEISGIDSQSGELCIRTDDEIKKFGVKQVAYLS